jgi:hypothetical protein
MSPTSGVLVPGEKRTITFTFTPVSEKNYEKVFKIKITDNPST